MSKYALSLALVIGAALQPAVAAAQDTKPAETEQTYLEFQVEQTAKIRNAVTPIYPDRLRAAKVEGLVLVQFVVNENGSAQMESFKVLRSTDNEFSEAVKKAVNASSFHPAEIKGKKVKQLVQQPYKFAAR